MGENVPEEPPGPFPPDLIADKWYCAVLLCFQDPEWDPLCFVPDRCVGEIVGTVRCCKIGANINGWWAMDLECESCWELCAFTGFSAQKLIDITGPYDNQPECAAACVP